MQKKILIFIFLISANILMIGQTNTMFDTLSLNNNPIKIFNTDSIIRVAKVAPDDSAKYVYEYLNTSIFVKLDTIKPQNYFDSINILTGNNSKSSSYNGFTQPVPIIASPTASGLTSQTSASTDLYTGRINVSYPITDISSRSISMPITLNYSSSGMKVDDVASWVGMGWNLNAGGVITRVMHGMPDEFNGTVSINGYEIPSYGYSTLLELLGVDFLTPAKVKNMNNQELQSLLENSEMSGNINNLATTTEGWDTQPDDFYFSFGQYSGKIVFNQYGEPVTIPHYNFKIDVSKREINGIMSIFKFTITTDDGVEYQFGSYNLNSVQFSKYISKSDNFSYYWELYQAAYQTFNGCLFTPLSGNLSTYPSISLSTATHEPFSSAWYLEKITTPDNDIMNFSYSKTELAVKYVQSKTVNFSYPNLPMDGLYYTTSPAKQTLTISETLVKQDAVYLSSITNSVGERVEFVSQYGRNDLVGGKKLIGIKLFNQYNDVVKYFNFDYDFVSTENERDINYVIFFTDNNNYVGFIPELMWLEEDDLYEEIFNSEYYRMFLTTITEYTGNTSASLPSTEFYYNFNHDMPKRFSNRQSTKGYCRNSNYAVMPSLQYNNIFSKGNIQPISAWGTMSLDDEGYPYEYFPATEPTYMGIQEDYVGLGMLTKIKYPTSGTKEFFYEPQGTYGVRLKEIKENYIFGDSIVTSYFYNGLNTANNNISYYAYRYSTAFSSCDGSSCGLSNLRVSSKPMNLYPSVGYSEVAVEKTGVGKIKYNFITSQNIPDEFNLPWWKDNGSWIQAEKNVFPFSKHFSTDWKRGIISDIYYYSENDLNYPIKHIYNDYDYSIFDKNYSYGLKSGITHVANFFWNSQAYTYEFWDFLPDFKVGFNFYYSDKYTLTQTIEKTYDVNYPGDETKAITTTTTYDYDVNYDFEGVNQGFVFLSKMTKDLSDGSNLITEYKYPFNSVDANIPADDMIEQFIVSSPVQVKVLKGNTLLSNIVYDYRIENGIVLPDRSRTYNIQTELFEPNIIFSEYDTEHNNNIIEYKTNNDIPISIIWGYDYSKPIAKIENENFYAVENALASLGYSIDGLQTKAKDELVFIFNNLRLLLPYTMITSYTYDLLSGLSSVTSPNGTTGYYFYDDFERLVTVRDMDYFILKHIEYVYNDNEFYYEPIEDVTVGHNCGTTITINSNSDDWDWYDNTDCSGDPFYHGLSFDFDFNGQPETTYNYTVKNNFTNVCESFSITVQDFPEWEFDDKNINGFYYKYSINPFNYTIPPCIQPIIVNDFDWTTLTYSNITNKFTLEVEENNNEYREASIKVIIDGLQKSFVIRQERKPYFSLQYEEISDPYGWWWNRKKTVYIRIKIEETENFDSFDKLEIYEDGVLNTDIIPACVIEPEIGPPEQFRCSTPDLRKNRQYKFIYYFTVLNHEITYTYEFSWS